ncbi:nitrophenyl compound nitroreductase subunit ArsF family protein [Petrimonas sulfuriphila]|jgi:uncharacterized protein YcfL|uniref:nitrophenyl compound nitroreductase subunit ArsF family protein n=1 Tax=Petrimonas TaxID=307628 RepID=UPI002B3A3E36|nr:nitrophenyl compound nitroreductase subunit ArsF family protein [Petrimonas sp.]MEA5070494.1 nitrophenyl compound nitroreductase subunit ArsF family protein [Petrimonas sp.]
MKKYILIGLFAVLLVACGCNTQKNSGQTTGMEAKEQVADASVVNVYYFHGKQRCKTCIAVEKVTKETIEKAYADNKNVRYVEINTEDKANAKLVEKYQITWNALIIEKGDSHIDLTKEGFANAVNTPDVLTELIKKEVNSRL